MFYEYRVARRSIQRWFEARRLRRRFRSAQEFAIGDMPEDTIGRITGTAQLLDGKQLVAPLTGRACVYYVLEIQENIGDLDTPGEILVSEQAGVPFVLEQAGHRALVEPTGAIVSVAFDLASKSKAAFDANATQSALLGKHGLVQRNWFRTNSLEYREGVIEVGETITILGSGVREPDPDAPPVAAYRSAGPTRLRITSSEKHPIAITDDPRSL